jgi:hypothetical protein
MIHFILIKPSKVHLIELKIDCSSTVIVNDDGIIIIEKILEKLFVFFPFYVVFFPSSLHIINFLHNIIRHVPFKRYGRGIYNNSDSVLYMERRIIWIIYNNTFFIYIQYENYENYTV